MTAAYRAGSAPARYAVVHVRRNTRMNCDAEMLTRRQFYAFSTPSEAV